MQQETLQTITIDSSSTGQRLDRFCRKFYKPYTDVSLSIIYQRIRKWTIRRNGKKSTENAKLEIDDTVALPVPAKKTIKEIQHVSWEQAEMQDVSQLLLHEDANRLVRNKPADMPMHHNKDTKQFALDDYLKFYTEKKHIQTTDTFRPSFCFRLDKDTSGIVIAAKNYTALQYLNELIRERETSKMYLACVIWAYPDHLEHNESLHKIVDSKFKRGKMIVDAKRWLACHSESRLIETKEDEILGTISLVKVRITTGRMHQIRVHLAHAGFPVLGDIVYGIPSFSRKLFKKYNIKRHLLHCRSYSFTDINHKLADFASPAPAEIVALFPDAAAMKYEG